MKLCIEPGCMATTAGARCALHERAHQRARNADPKRAAYNQHKGQPVPVGEACWCCGSTSDLTWHHVHPLAAGTDAPSATVPYCRSCNSSIGAKRMAGLACPMHGGKPA